MPQTTAKIAVPVGAAGSLGLMLFVGRHNPSRFLAVYAGVAFGPPRSKPAAAFLIVPLASWLLIAIAAAVSRRRRINGPRP